MGLVSTIRRVNIRDLDLNLLHVFAAVHAARSEGGPFKDLFDFCQRVDKRLANRRVIEALIRAGAFDPRDRYPTIAAFLAALDEKPGLAAHARLLVLIALGVALGVGLTTCALLHA